MTTPVTCKEVGYGYDPDPFGFWFGLRNALVISIVLWALIFWVACGCTTNPPADTFPWHGDGPNPPEPTYNDTLSPGARALLEMEELSR
jgi:hypothetical protein